MDEPKISVLFGYISLRPAGFVVNEMGQFGQQYERTEHARDGTVLARELLEPVAWLRYD
jgi:hypothetical protein